MYQQSQYRIVLIARYARQKDWNNLYVDHPYWCSIRNVCRYFYSHTKRLLRSFIVWQQVWTFYVGHHEACYTRPWIWTQTVSFVRKEILPYFIRNVCTVYKCKVNCKRPSFVCQLWYVLKELLDHRGTLHVACYWYLLLYPTILPNCIFKYYTSFTSFKKYHNWHTKDIQNAHFNSYINFLYTVLVIHCVCSVLRPFAIDFTFVHCIYIFYVFLIFISWRSTASWYLVSVYVNVLI